MSTSRNIKDRINRKNVCRTLTKLLGHLHTKDFSKGLIVYAGINEFEEEIFEFIEPTVKLNIFYYNCGDKFNVDIASDYLTEHTGNIIFANGDECIIYKFTNGSFVIVKKLNACLQKRQKHGGFSANRIARLAEETRHNYVTRIIDIVNSLERSDKMILFGSKEITSLIFAHKQLLVKLNNGGFLDFTNRTINNTKYFLNSLLNKDNNAEIYEQILLYLETDIDMLNFDQEKSDDMKYCISNDELKPNRIPFPSHDSTFYSRFIGFEYIGVKYYSHFVDDIDSADNIYNIDK